MYQMPDITEETKDKITEDVTSISRVLETIREENKKVDHEMVIERHGKARGQKKSGKALGSAGA